MAKIKIKVNESDERAELIKILAMCSGATVSQSLEHESVLGLKYSKYYVVAESDDISVIEGD